VVAVVAVGLWSLDRIFPLPLLDAQQAKLVVAANGTPLRAFADKDGIWRYPIGLTQVSDNYLDALIHYEDRWFYRHPGVNPFALLRATWQNLSSERIISGGSTLTMQVARMLVPQRRNLRGKAQQILRALQLEWHYSKEEILTAYLNRAPFGGTVEGVQAASYRYLGKSAELLSDAEAALLAVMPQAPSRYRPDRHPERAQIARDKLLGRLASLGAWRLRRVDDAMIEPVWAQRHQTPMHAPILSRRLVEAYPQQSFFQTTLDAGLQMRLEDLIRQRTAIMPKGTSAAVLVVENKSLAVRAYVGSADFGDPQRFGYIDMVRAVRSPGSTLKPFIYGMAIDRGLIHSQSLLVDAPSDFGDYRPQNFDYGFQGPVSVTSALQQSLNVPATQVLAKVGENWFMSRLKNSGMQLKLPRGAKANLALGLGGVGTSLESLVGVYSSLANQGYAGRPRIQAHEPIWQRRLLTPESAWVINDILASNSRPDQPAAHIMNYEGRRIAWKTGTSFGFRDSWAIAVNTDYTIGVWLGRPDGTPLPGYYGAAAAAPLLFTITNNLPPVTDAAIGIATTANQFKPNPFEPPSTVKKEVICWPLGGLLTETPPSHCHRHLEAWIMNDNVPLTFSEEDGAWGQNPLHFTVNSANGLRIDSLCDQTETQTQSVALWPKAVEPWVEKQYRRQTQIPTYDPSCKHPPNVASAKIQIIGLHDGSQLQPVAGSLRMPRIDLRAIGGQGKRYWFINNQLKYVLAETESRQHRFTYPGRYVIAVVDEQGGSDEVSFSVQP